MTDPKQPAPPVPRRYYWLKRLSIFAAMVLCLLGMVRWRWGVEAEKRLQAEIAIIKARGEPLFLEDFVIAPVADEDNAAKALLDALAMWDVTNMMLDDRKYLADNAKVLALVRSARDRPGCDWGIIWASPAIGISLPHLGSQRDLTLKLVDVAKRQHQLGDHAQALRTLQDVIHLAQLENRSPNYLINHLVALSIHEQAYEALETLLPTMQDHPDVRHELAIIRDQLLNEQAFNRANVRAYFGERLFMLDTGVCVVRGELSLPGLVGLVGIAGGGNLNWWSRATTFVIAPLIKLDMAHFLQRFSQKVQAANAVRLEDCLAMLPKSSRDNPNDRYRYPITFAMEPATKQAMKTHFQTIAKRRMVAIAIAIRLFEFDRGQRPKSLKALVPDYLPAIPEDPLAPAGEPLKYNRTSVYSAGTGFKNVVIAFQLDGKPVSLK